MSRAGVDARTEQVHLLINKETNANISALSNRVSAILAQASRFPNVPICWFVRPVFESMALCQRRSHRNNYSNHCCLECIIVVLCHAPNNMLCRNKINVVKCPYNRQLMERGGRRVGEKERRRDGETERRRDGETERLRDGETERRRDGETERRRDGETVRRRDGETVRR